MAERLGYRPELDGLRAVAVLAVVAEHWRVLDAVGFQGGWVGVDLFFVLSGFLITSLLLEEAAAGGVSLRGFYVRRVRRLFPALAVFLAVCVGVAVLVGGAMQEATTVGALSAAGYVSNFVATNTPVDLTSHTWSLSIEEHFYLVWPAVLIAAHRWRGELGVLAAALTGAGVAVVLRQLEDGMVYTQTQLRADGLLIGCALAVVVRRRQASRVEAGVAGVVGAVWLLVVLVVASAFDRWVWSWGFTLNALAAAAVILCVVTVRPRVLAHPALVRIGVLSYGIYLWHNAIGKALWWPSLGPLPTLPRTLLLGALTGAVAVLSYELVETRFRSLHKVEHKERARVDLGSGRVGSVLRPLQHDVARGGAVHDGDVHRRENLLAAARTP